MRYFGFKKRSFGLKTIGWAGSRAFTPSDLFENGEQGVWFDPSDLSTMYQDVNGTEPVTKDGDPVGLILDKSQGLKLSPNILPNSDFSDGLTGWPVGFPSVVSATMVDGKCVLEHIGTLRGAALGLEPTLNFEEGKTYKLIVDVEDIGASTLDMAIYVFQDDTQVTHKVIGRDTLMMMFTAKSSSMKIRFGFDLTSTMAPTNSKIIIHSIKAQELSGNHAMQETASARPIYRTDGELHWLEFDGVDDSIASNDFGLVQPHTYAVASTLTPFMLQGSKNIADGLPGNSSSLVVRRSGARLYAGTGNYDPPPLEVGKRVFIAKFNGDNSILLNNGISGGVRQVGSTNPRGVTLSRSSDASIYGFISVSKVTTNTEDLAVNAYLAAKSGVTL